MDESSPLAHENFDLRCRLEALTAQLNELAGGDSQLQLHEELTSARSLLAAKEAELAELNELFCSVEGETAAVRAERDAAETRASAATATAAEAESHKAIAAEASRQHAAAVGSQAREAFGTRMLRAELVETEQRAERACFERAECLASLLVAREAADQALARGARGRDELSDELRSAQAEAARQQGALGALETRVRDLTAELASARQQVESERERALASEAHVGKLNVEATGRMESQERALADAASASRAADEARSACATAQTESAERACEIATLRAELLALRASGDDEKMAAGAKVDALEAATRKADAAAEEQRAAAETVNAQLRKALDEATRAREAAVDEAAQGRREAEVLRQALATAQAQSKAEVAREVGKARGEVAAAHREREEALDAMQRRVDEQMDLRATTESKWRAAHAEASRLSKCERQAATLDDKCRALQAELEKKRDMLERVYKRRQSSMLPPAAAPPLAPPPALLPPSAPSPTLAPPPPPPLETDYSGGVDAPQPPSSSSSSIDSAAAPVPVRAVHKVGGAIVAYSDDDPPPPPPPPPPVPRDSRSLHTLPTKGFGPGSGGLSARSTNSANRAPREPSPRPGDDKGVAGRVSLGSISGSENGGGRASSGGRRVKHVESRFLSPKVRNV